MRFNFDKLIFENQNADKNKTAVWGTDGNLSWAELENVVHKIMKLVSDLEVPNSHPIIIYGHKEKIYPAAILALMASNIVYIPIDTIYPAARIEKIIRQTGCQIIINCGSNPLPVDIPVEINCHAAVIASDIPAFSHTVASRDENPICYIMFTSGSTGEPKGVQISRRSIISFLDWADKDFNFCNADVFMNQAPFTFDVSLFDILISFHYGASVFLVNRSYATNASGFFDLLNQTQVSVWTSTPSFIYMFLREKEFNMEHLPSIKTFVFAGEILPHSTVKMLRKQFPNARIINAYGPTEATIITTWVEITDEIVAQPRSLPIGYPKRNAEMFILPENSSSDSPGEIIIAGDHVSIGYFNNCDLTEKKFFIHQGMQAFRTGDLGFFHNKMLYFSGRNDDQIKLHGYRIELSEIDAVISSLEEIESAITVPVVVKGDVKRLITFIILGDNAPCVNAELFSSIKQRIQPLLPPYMIPGEIVNIDAFPVSANFKIDKNALLEYYKNR